MDWLYQVSASIAASLIFKFIVVPLLMTIASAGVLRFAFNKLKKGKEIIAFGVGCFLLFLTLIVLFARPQQPELSGGIQSVITGQAPGSERDIVAFFTINIINTGSMQTIVKSWKVEASSNGRKYDAVFSKMPPTFTFNNIPRSSPMQAESVTFKGEDDILEKALVPLQVGAIMPGVLFVLFQNVDSSVFKAGVDYKITFEDVFSKQYSMSLSSTGKMDNLATFPGVHTDMVCPLPPGGLGTKFHTRQMLGDKGSRQWREAMTACERTWNELFPNTPPFSGKTIREYVTENCDDFPICAQ